MNLKQSLTTLGLCAAIAGALAMAPEKSPGPGKSPEGRNSAPAEKSGAAERSKPQAKIGEAAPAFTLNDATGKPHSLADHAGKIVVLEWINYQCPVCKRVYDDGIIKKTVEELNAIDPSVVYLAINSTHSMEDSANAKFLADHKVDFPALNDKDGKVGRAYGAKTTPHIFVIDTKGVLRYQGALDDDPNGKKASGGEVVTNYVVDAVKQIKTGDTVSPDTTKPYGCSVKYNEGGEKGPKGERGEKRD